MKNIFAALLLSGSAVLSGAEIAAPVIRMMIFRNSYGVLRHAAVPGKAKTFYVTGDLAPRMGTLWTSPNVAQIRKIEVEKEKSHPVTLNDITRTYKNQRVVLMLEGGKTISGTVLAMEKAGKPDVNAPVAVKCSNGKTIVLNRKLIVGVESSGLKSAERKEKYKCPAWEFTMISRKDPGKVFFDYVTDAVNWQGSYRIKLSQKQRMLLQYAVDIANVDAPDLEDVECVLFAGTPNLKYAGTLSSMAMKNAPHTPAPAGTWRRNKYSAGLNVMMASGAVDGTSVSPEIDNNMASFDPGKVTLKKGEVLHRQISSGSGSYRNLVRWQIPCRVSDSGTYARLQRNVNRGSLWECIKFTNPFKHAMPEGAVEIVDGSRVVAQSSVPWVNKGMACTIEVIPCQDVTGEIVEHEAPSSKPGKLERFAGSKLPAKGVKGVKRIMVRRQWFRITDIKGKLTLVNHRSIPAAVRVEMECFGEVVKVSGKPVITLNGRRSGINPCHKIVWTLSLKPGEKCGIDYRYNVILSE